MAPTDIVDRVDSVASPLPLLNVSRRESSENPLASAVVCEIEDSAIADGRTREERGVGRTR